MQPHTKGPPRTSPQKVKCQEKAPAESVQSGWSWGLPWSAPTGWTTCTCTRTLICERAQEQAIPQPKPPEQPARKGNNRLQTYDYSVTGGWQEEVDLEAANPPWNDDVGFLLEQHLVAAALKRQADAAQGSSSSSTSGAAPRTDSPGRPIGTSSERVQNDHQHAGRPQKAPESPQRSAGSASPPQRERGRPKAGDAGGSLAATARDDAHVHDSGLPGSEDADDERGAGLCVGPSTASAEALHSPRPPTSPGCAGVSRCCDGQGEAAFPPQRASISTADPSPGSSSLEGSPELTSGTRQGNSTQSPRTGDCHQTHERQQQRLPTPNNKDPPSTTATTTTTAAAATAEEAATSLANKHWFQQQPEWSPEEPELTSSEGVCGEASVLGPDGRKIEGEEEGQPTCCWNRRAAVVGVAAVSSTALIAAAAGALPVAAAAGSLGFSLGVLSSILGIRVGRWVG